MILKNARVFINGEFMEKDITIEDGLISEIGTAKSSRDVFDCKGMHLLPGLIDPHVHLREPGDMKKEDFTTGTSAALAGGFTSVCDMPNNRVPITTKERYLEKQALVKKKAKCNVFLSMAGVDENYSEVKDAQPTFLKLYLGHTTGGLIIEDERVISKHFGKFAKDKPLVVHSEDIKMTHRLVRYARTYENRMHLAHAHTADQVRTVKTLPRGSVEVAPHHLFLDKKYCRKHKELCEVKPPLQKPEVASDLWTVLQKVDCIATDHAPHTLADKKEGAFGFPGLETSLAVMLKGYFEGKYTFEWLIDCMSRNPARIFNLEKRGMIEVGNHADLTLVDLHKEWTVKGEELETKCKWSPFEGWTLKGKAHSVWVGGKQKMEEFEVF